MLDSSAEARIPSGSASQIIRCVLVFPPFESLVVKSPLAGSWGASDDFCRILDLGSASWSFP